MVAKELSYKIRNRAVHRQWMNFALCLRTGGLELACVIRHLIESKGGRYGRRKNDLRGR